MRNELAMSVSGAWLFHVVCTVILNPGFWFCCVRYCWFAGLGTESRGSEDWVDQKPTELVITLLTAFAGKGIFGLEQHEFGFNYTTSELFCLQRHEPCDWRKL